MHDTTAAKDLLFRRLRCLANYENANKVSYYLQLTAYIPHVGKCMRASFISNMSFITVFQNLDKARARNKDVQIAENAQQEAVRQFEKISEHAKVNINCLICLVLKIKLKY